MWPALSRPSRRGRINYIHRDLNRRRRFKLSLLVQAHDPLQAGALRRKIDKLGYARLQGTRPCCENNYKEQVRNDKPKIDIIVGTSPSDTIATMPMPMLKT